MVISVTALTGVLGMGALSIDLSTWYQHHHQAQVAADAAALAAAGCLANAASGQTCTSTTDTTDAANVATTFAAENGATIAPGNVSFNNGIVTVTTAQTSPPLFARIVGMGATTQTVQAKANYQQQTLQNVCDSTQAAAGSCLFAYGEDTNCPDLGVTLENIGSVDVTGAIWSNSDLETVNADHNSTWGSVSYGNGNLCSWIGASVSNGPVFGSGPTATTAYSGWPRDFRPYLACGPSATYQCTGPGGTPSYCTQAAPAFGLNLLGDVTSLPSLAAPQTVTAGQVYCAYGTSLNKNDPSTWNGVIDMTSSNSSTTDSFIGGEVVLTATGSVSLGPQLDTPLGHVLVYANDSLVAANVANAGSANIDGDVFAPNGAITASSAGSGTYKAFLEGYQVVIDAQGKFVGEGPISSTFTTTGTDQLVQ